MKKPDSQATLLNYAITSTPNPLQASTKDGSIVYAALTMVVSSTSSKPVVVSDISIYIPSGTGTNQLTNSPDLVLTNADPQRVWSIVPDGGNGVFDIFPVTGQPVTVNNAASIIFQFYNIVVNQVPGTVGIVITETATLSGGDPTERQVTIPVTKFPYGFFFDNFAPSKPLVRCNDTVTLTWEGSNQAVYSMSYIDSETPLDVTNVRTWTSPALTNDTTFLLRAIVTSVDGPVEKILTTTVIVLNPELQATSLQVSGPSILQGDNTFGSDNTRTQVNGDSNLNGNVTIGSNVTQMEVNCSSTFIGNVNIGEGEGSLASLFVANQIKTNGVLTVQGGAYLNGYTNIGSDDSSQTNIKGVVDISKDLTVHGAVNFGGLVKLSANLNMMNTDLYANAVNGQMLSSYQTQTNSIVIGNGWVIAVNSDGNLVFGLYSANSPGYTPVVTFSTKGKIST
jgi:hypothetical protein